MEIAKYPSRKRAAPMLSPFHHSGNIVAYFSMEVGLDAALPTYSGGLGILAGDTLRAAADLGVPMVAVTLLHRKGYFRQRLDAAGNQLAANLVQRVLGEERTAALAAAQCGLNGTLNMTHLALRFARYVNGVAMRHGEVSRGMFPDYPIDTITNGVHAITWTAVPFRNLYDRRIPEWRRDNFYLRYAVSIPLFEIQRAHSQAKRQLLERIEQQTGIPLAQDTFTLGFARRATAYKRADLLFSDLDRLKTIAHNVGPLQIVYAGKAHPRDEGGKALVRRIFEASAKLGEDVRVVYLENYDMALAKAICAGVDIWLNTPQRPQEASGTSGMKAALNGVPSLSVLDGWWIEGHVEGVTGWAIGEKLEDSSDPISEVDSLYDKLEWVILPLFHQQPMAFAEVRRSAIALNGSFFNTQRMVFQYLRNAYFGVES